MAIPPTDSFEALTSGPASRRTWRVVARETVKENLTLLYIILAHQGGIVLLSVLQARHTMPTRLSSLWDPHSIPPKFRESLDLF